MLEEIQRQRRRFNRAYEVLNQLPFPDVTCDELRDLHNDVSEYDVSTIKFIQEHGSNPPMPLEEDAGLSESLSNFKARLPAEIEGRRELLFYKRKVDTLIKEYNRLSSLLTEVG